ncbi:uncharacterized protein si:ch211-136m16.8 [Notolabrus celidotus]|uniref:uncharacterized protein si:ch211-136m16.8 n=1 Tax=Notolabrus celidotus TaxID=1203425 RepID=UPI00148FDC8B|nr:uncharacterized protein si:ch211-136m16.8 [Notolabrus celidotus]
MDSDGPLVSRVERTFWTVWYYITGAVNRLLRPESENTVGNDPNSPQETAVDRELAKCSQKDEVSDGEVQGEQTLATASLLSPSRPAVAWDLCTTEIDLGTEMKDSEKDEDKREEELVQIGCDESELLVAKDNKEDNEGNLELYIHRQVEMLEYEKTDELMIARSQILINNAISEDLAGTEEETERMKTPDFQTVEEITTRVQEQEEDDIEIRLNTATDLPPKEEASIHKEEASSQRIMVEVENSNSVLLQASENENRSDEGTVKDDSEELVDVSIPVSELIVAGLEHAMAPRNKNDESDKVKEHLDESKMEEVEQVVIEEDNVNKAEEDQALDDVPEHKGEIPTITGDRKDAETELYTEGRQKDVARDIKVQINITGMDDGETERYGAGINEKAGVDSSNIPADDKILDKDQVQEGNEERVTSVTVKDEGETRQETSWEFQNIPEGVFKGQSVVSQEPKPLTCKEAQEGVPEYNNEPEPDENTTQRFLEVGDSKEVQSTQLPEEVESEELESLQNSGSKTGADYLEVREHIEKGQESKSNFDLGGSELQQETKKPLFEPIPQELGPLSVEEDRELLVTSMKTGINHSEKEFESDFGLTSKKDLQDGAEDILVDMDEGLRDPKEAEDALDSFMKTENLDVLEAVDLLEAGEQTTKTYLQESVDAVSLEQNINETYSLIEDITAIGFMKQSVETELQLLAEAEQEDSSTGLEIASHGVVQKVAEVVVQSKKEDISDLEVTGMATELLTEKNKKEHDLIAELELSRKVKSPETENLLLDFEAAHESETTDFKPKDVTLISREEVLKSVTESEESGEERVLSISGSREIIDEEILDMWIETLSEENEKHQEEPELGKQKHPETELSIEKQTEKDEELLVETNSGESEIVSDMEMSLSTTESGFSDQSLSEWGTQNNESQLPKSISTGSIHGMFDVFGNVSASIPKSSPQQHDSECQDASMRGTDVAGQLYLKDNLSQDSEKTLDSTDEETGSQGEIHAEEKGVLGETGLENTEEADVKSQTEVRVEETVIEAEALEINLSDSQDEIKHTESASSGNSSEVWSEEGILSTESGSQEDSSTESEKSPLKLPLLDNLKPRCLEDIPDSVSGPNKAEVEDQLTSPEDQTEVDVSNLDFTAQRSRIAVKNPLVRPPKDPRSLILLPSLDPTPVPRLQTKVPAAVPLGGMGIGIKLPGLGAGFPVLKKTQRKGKDENSPESNPQEPETKPEEMSDTPKQDETQHKPRWMPPKHPGFGNPLMSELKTKLKKTTKD